jgi:hypothetical protein
VTRNSNHALRYTALPLTSAETMFPETMLPERYSQHILA